MKSNKKQNKSATCWKNQIKIKIKSKIRSPGGATGQKINKKSKINQTPPPGAGGTRPPTHPPGPAGAPGKGGF